MADVHALTDDQLIHLMEMVLTATRGVRMSDSEWRALMLSIVAEDWKSMRAQLEQYRARVPRRLARGVKEVGNGR